MAYATLYHLTYHHSARATYTASSVPNASAAVMCLDEAAGEIDFSLTKGGYDAPLLSSAPSAVKAFFQKANAYGALWMLEASAQQSHNRDAFATMFHEAKQMIETGQIPGMDKNDEESLPRFAPGATPPYFTRDMRL